MRESRGAPAEPATETRAVDVQMPWVGRHNYALNSAIVLRDVYRLLSLVMADEAISKVCGGEFDELALMRGRFIEDELVHLLISTAVMNRIHDDHMSGPRKDDLELSYDPVDHCCGILKADLAKEESLEGPLTFREACNKIVHAAHITAETEEIEGGAYSVLPRLVVLKGVLGKTAWQAHLNVPDYARATWINFRDL